MKASEAKKISQSNCEDSIGKVLGEIKQIAEKGKFELLVYYELNFKQTHALQKLGYKLENLGGATMDANYRISW